MAPTYKRKTKKRISIAFPLKETRLKKIAAYVIEKRVASLDALRADTFPHVIHPSDGIFGKKHIEAKKAKIAEKVRLDIDENRAAIEELIFQADTIEKCNRDYGVQLCRTPTDNVANKIQHEYRLVECNADALGEVINHLLNMQSQKATLVQLPTRAVLDFKEICKLLPSKYAVYNSTLIRDGKKAVLEMNVAKQKLSLVELDALEKKILKKAPVVDESNPIFTYQRFLRTEGTCKSKYMIPIDQPDIHKYYDNLNDQVNLMNVRNALKQQPPMPGINLPQIFVGARHSCFGAHLEDLSFDSSILQIYGRKLVVCVEKKDIGKFHTYVHTHFWEKGSLCEGILRHKYAFEDLDDMEAAGFSFEAVILEPNQLLIIPGGVAHFGINLEFSISESTNFASKSWLKDHQSTSSITKVAPEEGKLCSSCQDNQNGIFNTLDLALFDAARDSENINFALQN